MAVLKDLASNPKFFGFEPLRAEDAKKLDAAYPGLPGDYREFLRSVGYGQTEKPTYVIYGGPLTPAEVYDKRSAKALQGLVIFGDDMQGYCNAFDPAAAWSVVEIDLHTKQPLHIADTFLEFVRARILKVVGATTRAAGESQTPTKLATKKPTARTKAGARKKVAKKNAAKRKPKQ